ncbi:MAG: polyprenol monophosphomannose synthase [Kiritimatiellae bacterium]|nr:polyprenol monophosphomannose synthase [Kiritimatiellia bacterium]MBR4945526.1 polyprenol monophosphomannose synthase [Kiritimatiellia bacterium]MBR5587682.1 polyprenol monophosphomannose synthase [Kiritimatiellia bacterium]
MAKTLVVVPTYNEKENIEAFTEAVFTHLPTAHILIVDDNSPDGTGAIADRLAEANPAIFVLHRTQKEGLGRAYVAGFQWALQRDYAFIIQTDADFSHDPKDLPRLLGATETADLVIGSRYKGGCRVLNWPLRRLMLSYGAGIYVRLFTRMPVMDPTGGFKCFHRTVLEAIQLDQIAAEGYGFQIEVTHTAWRKGFTIKEIPIVFADRVAGTSKMSLAIAKEAILLVLKLAFRR